VAKRLPARPNLEHLRRQAKSLLAGIAAGDAAAIDTLREFLPAAASLPPAQVAKSGFRLADAQSAVARQSGFASWPQLGRHVDTLRALEGTWAFESLRVGGQDLPPAALSSSRILIDGDRFRTESPEATYEGEFDLDVEAEPHHLDIAFVAGPEAGNTNRGIFRLEGDLLEICLDIAGGPRPKAFASKAGSSQAHERLRRSTAARPAGVTGGTPPEPPPEVTDGDVAAFAHVPSPTLQKLQGEWSAVQVVRDGQELPAYMCKSGLRTAKDNEVRVSFGGQLMIHALVRLDAAKVPMQVDYLNVGGAAKGTRQLGLFEWRGGEACFCMAAPGQPRPEDFTCAIGSGRTFSRWQKRG
jgi:uncharacterized protein (TIGR03067 family)